MKYIFLFLVVIAGLVTGLFFPSAYSDFSPNDKYLIQALGYLSGKQTISDSSIALQLTIGSMNGSTIQSSLDNGLITIADAHYLNSGIWQTSILRDGKYLVIQGDAQDQNGNVIHLNLFGRIIDNNPDGYVYSITGKIIGSETMKVSYSAKIKPVSTVTTKPTIIPSTQTQQSSSSNVSISIVYGASDINNQVHFTPSNVQVALGTTIIWTNNDSVPHRIMSGIAKPLTTDQLTPIFAVDGKFDSGTIAPGQSFKFTVTKFDTSQSLDPTVAKRYNIPQDQTAGGITFFDPAYPFMVGVIAPISQPITQQKTVQMNIIQGASDPNNGQFLSPSTSLQITPGTVVVWTNNDSVPHRIMSGQIYSTTEGTGGGPPSTAKNAPHFVSDGKIDSGVIAPGQHYQVIVSNSGSTQFFDPSFTWINGIIISAQTITTGTPIQISIALGSSLPKGTATQQQFNQYNTYYSPDTVQIVPGTAIIWVNNDSIEHTILSGTSTQKNTNPFIPDGKITSGKIAPGQTFMVVVNDTGIIRFYDPQYTWMNGVIISMPPTSSYTIAAKSYNPSLH
jgi:plastocyanin